jgi:hypothetical protein
VRFGTDKIINWGDQSKPAIAFNDQVCLSRHRLESFDDECIILYETAWENHEVETIRENYKDAVPFISARVSRRETADRLPSSAARIRSFNGRGSRTSVWFGDAGEYCVEYFPVSDLVGHQQDQFAVKCLALIKAQARVQRNKLSIEIIRVINS